MPRTRSWSLAVAVVAALWAPEPACAQDAGATVHLRWPGTGECMSEDSARAAVIDRLGRDPFGQPGAGVLELSVACEADDRGTEVRFELHGPDGTALGERELHVDAGCRRIDREIAIVLALLIESQASTIVLSVPVPSEPDPAPEPSRPDSEPSPPPPLRVDAPVPIPSAPERGPSLALSASVGAALGTLAPGVLSARVGAGLVDDVIDARISLGAAFGGPLGGGPSVDASAALLAVTGCAGSSDSVRLEGCLDVEAGMTFARGVGLDEPQSTDAPWLAVGAALGVDFRLTPGVVLETGVEVTVPLVRPVFTVEPSGAVAHEPWPVAPTLRIGISGLWQGGA